MNSDGKQPPAEGQGEDFNEALAPVANTDWLKWINPNDSSALGLTHLLEMLDTTSVSRQ